MSGYAAWNEYAPYAAGDVVTYAGLNYVAASNNLNVVPFPVTPVWTLIPSGGGGGGGGLTNPLTTNLDMGANQIINTTLIETEIIKKATLTILPEIEVQDAMNFTSATPTIFNGAIPQTPLVPTTGDELVNKTYVDGIPPGWVGTAASDLNMAQFNITNVPLINVQEGVNQNFTELTTGSLGPSDTFFQINPKLLSGGVPSTYTIRAGYDNLTNVLLVCNQSTPVNSLAILEAAGGTVSLGDMNAFNNTRIDITTFNNDINLNADTVRITPNTAVTTTLDVSGSIVLSGSASTPTAPTTGNNLTNKTYVDGFVKFRPTREFWVSTNGNDTTGNGSVINPYATIQKGITEAELVSGVIAGVAQIAVVNVASGHYNEDLTFNKGYVVVNGVLSTQTASEVVELTGGVTISCVGTNDVFQRMVVFQGMNITCPAGKLITDNSTASHLVAFQDCKVATDGQFFLGASTAPDQRTYFTNVDIFQSNSATTSDILFFNLGQVEIERVDMGIAGNASAIEIGGTAILSRMSLTTIESGTASTTAAPILLISSTTLSSHNIGNSTFFYSNAASKALSPTSSAIRIASGVNTTLVLLNNYFTMTGLTGSGNNVITYNGVGTPALLMNECRSLSIPVVAAYTTTIQSGITKVNYTNMNGPATGSYSSTATQPAAAAGAATTLTFNTTEKEFNTSLQATNRIYALATGTYRFDYSIQFDNLDAAAQTANIWISKNGTNVPRSASTIRLGASGAAAHQQFPFCSYTLDMNAGDYVSVIFNATSTNVRALAAVAAGIVPAIPSIIVNLQQVGS